MAASLPWLLLSYIIAYQFRSFASYDSVTLADKVWAVAAPLIALCALIFASVLFARRLRGSGWLLAGVCIVSFLGFASHLVWFTGGV